MKVRGSKAYTEDSVNLVSISKNKAETFQKLLDDILSALTVNVTRPSLGLGFKHEDGTDWQKNELIDLKDARHKLIAFFVVAFIILLFYWYFISAFCAVYPNTQKIYLIDCTISFLIFSSIPFIVYAITTIFRVISLKDNNKKRCSCIYLAGQLFPIA
jgi:hypothetical protein